MLRRGKGTFPEPSKSDRTSAGGNEWEGNDDLGGGIKNKQRLCVSTIFHKKKKGKDSRGWNKHTSACQVI